MPALPVGDEGLKRTRLSDASTEAGSIREGGGKEE